MFSMNFLLVLPLIFSLSQAHLVARVTGSSTSYLNTSSTTSSSASAITQKCCFVVQDTVSQEWWQQTEYEYAEVNLTSITTYITKYPNVTSTHYETSIYTTNRTFSKTVGANPLTNYLNFAPGPSQAAHELNGTQAITTAGVTIQSPAAFLVYNTVRIITVPVVTDDGGNAQCGTPSVPEAPPTASFNNINSHAQAYFGGSSIANDIENPTLTREYTTTETFTETIALPEGGEGLTTVTTTAIRSKIEYETVYVDAEGSTVTNDNKPTGTVISLVTPFIYQPPWGATGKKGFPSHCDTTAVVDNYGYIPQSLLDFLIQNEQYSMQFPGLEDCLPGGPSILPGVQCGLTASFTQSALGGDLTESTVIYVNPPGIKPDPTPKPDPKPIPRPADPPKDTSPPADRPAKGPGKPAGKAPGNQSGNQQGGGAESQLDGGSSGGGGNPGQPPAETKAAPDLGWIINSIMGGPHQEVPGPTPKGNPIVIPSATVIPVAEAPPGVTGEIHTFKGSPVYVIPGPTTIPAPAFLPAGAENLGSKTMIGGSPYVVIPGPTNIPLSDAPAGIGGSTTMIGGVPYIAIPGPVTFAAPPAGAAGGAGSIGSTTLIGGVPFVVYPGPTNIPLSNAPAGLSGTTTEINGVPYLVIPAPTTIAAAPAAGETSLGRTTLINGTPFVVIPGPTMIPAKGAPSAVSDASTTLVNGTPYLIIPSQTTVELSPSNTGVGGQLTVIIDGSSRLIIAGPTTIPVNPDFPISGKTTVIGGKTMVIVSGPTTVAAKASKTSSSTRSTSSSTRPTPTAAPSPVESAPPSGAGRGLGFNACLLGVGVLVAAFL